MTRYLARLGLACTLVTAVGACVDERALSSATDLPAQTAFVEPRLQQVLDNLPGERLLRELSDADPSFGGYFADADSLVVLTTDLGRAESLRAVTEAKRPRPDRRGLSASSRPIAIRQGRYTFRQLARWRGVALTLVAGLPDFAGFDLDEGRNRLVVFLTDGSGEDAMRSALSDSSIPDDAITYEIIGELILETDITDQHFPVQGGFDVYAGYEHNGQKGACTIGFNAQIEGNNVFVTASHCSHAFTSLDSDTAFHSGVAWAPIAREWRDPPAFNCPFPWSGLCRLSDAAAFRYDISADSIDFGIIAQPYLETIQINPADSIFEVVGKWSANPPPQYSTLYHIGIDQGFQGGFLMSTCSAVKFKYEQGGPERTILCVNKYATDSDTGDSGGPVFTIESDDEVALTGIHTGRTQCCFGVPILVDHWCTDFAAIEADLGSMWVWEPFGGDPLTAEIDGPSDVPPYYTEGCEWWANVSGGTGSYTYEWKWDGQVVGTDYFYAYEGATEGQHWLEVSVGDGTASAWDGMIVDTDYSHSCLPF